MLELPPSRLVRRRVRKVRRRLVVKFRRKHRYGVDWMDDVDRTSSWADGALLIDVGANVGEVTTALAMRYPDRTVLAFEPIASTRTTLRNAVSQFENVRVFGEALSDHVGTASMVAIPNAETNRIVESPGASSREAVATTTLDNVLGAMGWPAVGLLKIDTEGHDLKVLRGAEAGLRRGLVDTVVLECTFNLRGAPHVDVLDVLPMMRDLGYDVAAVYSENIGRFTRGSGHSNLLFVRR